MPNLNDICRSIVEDVDCALAAAVVEQNTGLLIGVSNNTSLFSQSHLDVLAAAAVDMFRGRGVARIEKMIAELRKTEPRPLLRELQFSTDETYHFMTVVPGKADLLALLITSRDVNIGMGWANLRTRLAEIAAASP